MPPRPARVPMDAGGPWRFNFNGRGTKMKETPMDKRFREFSVHFGVMDLQRRTLPDLDSHINLKNNL